MCNAYLFIIIIVAEFGVYMLKKLPINCDTDITTHCDIYNYLCIAGVNIAQYETWLMAKHFLIGIDKDNNIQLCQNEIKTDFYSPLLNQIQWYLHEYNNSSQYIEHIQVCINEAKHVVINRIMFPFPDEEHIRNINDHEIMEITILIYGYDNVRRMFLTSMMNSQNYRMSSCEVPFDIIQESFDMLKLRKYHVDKLHIAFVEVGLTNCFSAPVSVHTLQHEYDMELSGSTSNYHYYAYDNAFEPLIPVCYGVPAIERFIVFFKNQDNQYDLKNISLSIGRWYEHGKLNLRRMLRLIHLHVDIPQRIIEQYAESVNLLRISYAMVYKLICSNDMNYYNRINLYLDKSCRLQKQVLRDIINVMEIIQKKESEGKFL